MTKISRVFGATLAAAILSGCAVPTETESGTNTSSSSTPKTGTTSASNSTATDGGKPSDGGWTVESTNIKDDGLGSFGGTARVTNTDDETQTGVFTFTLFKGDEQLGSLQGSASEVEAGKTATVQMVSQDDYVKGPYRVEFQKDF